MLDASSDDDEEDSARVVAELVEVRLVEFASDVAEALVAAIEDKCVEDTIPVLPTCPGGQSGLATGDTAGEREGLTSPRSSRLLFPTNVSQRNA